MSLGNLGGNQISNNTFSGRIIAQIETSWIWMSNLIMSFNHHDNPQG